LLLNGVTVAEDFTGASFCSRTMTFGNGCSGGSTTTSVQSNAPVEIREEPSGDGNGNGNGGLGAQSVIENIVELLTIEDED